MLDGFRGLGRQGFLEVPTVARTGILQGNEKTPSQGAVHWTSKKTGAANELKYVLLCMWSLKVSIILWSFCAGSSSRVRAVSLRFTIPSTIWICQANDLHDLRTSTSFVCIMSVCADNTATVPLTSFDQIRPAIISHTTSRNPIYSKLRATSCNGRS